MSGNDCTDAQIEHARTFLEDFASTAGARAPEVVAIPRDALIRLLAWYGALRYDACDRGVGTLETPGMIRLRWPDEVKR